MWHQVFCAFSLLSHALSWGAWLVLVSFVAVSESLAQHHAQLWQIEDGLPHNAVQAIAQTSDGYLWVGTRTGLARFDGVSFIQKDPPGFEKLKRNSIYALCADTNGVLWIGFERDGLGRLEKGAYRHYTEKDGLASDSVRALCRSTDGSLWVATTNGVTRFYSGKLETYRREDGLPHEVVRSIGEDSDGNIWLGTSAEATVALMVQGKVQEFVKRPDLPGTLRAICRDGENNLWLGSFAGLVGTGPGRKHIYSDKNGLTDNKVVSLFWDSRGALWIGCYGGLSRLVKGKIIPELTNAVQVFDMVNAILEDHEGNMWVGAKDGLYRLNPKRFRTYTRQQGLLHNNIMSVMEDSQNNLWIGTWGGGLHRLNESGMTAFGQNDGLMSDVVLALLEDRAGALWVGMDFDHGMYRYWRGKFRRYYKKDGLEDRTVRVLHQDKEGNLWIGATSGLVQMNGGKFKRFTVKDGLSANTVRVIHEDRQGRLLVGTQGGLSMLHEGKITNFGSEQGLPEEPILALHEDAEGVLWIGTGGGGLCYYKEGRFTTITSAHGLFCDEIFDLLEDDRGGLWMSSPVGVFWTEKKALLNFATNSSARLHCVSFGKPDGLATIQCNGVAKPGAWKTGDGRLWFATAKGLAVTDSNLPVESNQIPPPVVIERFFADEKPVAMDGAMVIAPPGRGELTFHYTALSFRSPEKIKFKYKLEGLDTDWISAGNQRIAQYNNIYPGEYRFRVLACNNEGVWNEQGASLNFVVKPFYWQTWWFSGLMGVTLFGIVGASVRYISTRRLKRKLEKLEQQHALEKERARIAKDLHDEIGSSLTQIALLSELGRKNYSSEGREKHFQKIAQTSHEVVEAVDQIVWALNPQNDTLDNLANYICHFANNFFQLSTVKCRLDVPPSLPRIAISAEARHNLFLSLKEALNNVLKHAEADELWIRLDYSKDVLSISVEDNGRGIDSARQDPTGNGLINMRKRLEQIGGQFDLQCHPSGGTKIRFTIRLSTHGAGSN